MKYIRMKDVIASKIAKTKIKKKVIDNIIDNGMKCKNELFKDK